MKINESKLPKLLRILSLVAQIIVFAAYSTLLVAQTNAFDGWKYPVDFFRILVIVVSFSVGCLGIFVVLGNYSAVRLLRPDFPLLVFICLLPMGSLQYFFGLQNLSFQRINDVSTDTANPPQFWFSRSERQIHLRGFDLWGALQASDKIAAHPDISSVTFLALPDLVYECALRTAYALNWKVTIRDPVARVFEVKTTNAYIVKSADAVIRVVDASDGYSIVDVRSASPNDRIDGGFNALIIKSFMTSLKRLLVNRGMLDHC